MKAISFYYIILTISIFILTVISCSPSFFPSDYDGNQSLTLARRLIFSGCMVYFFIHGIGWVSFLNDDDYDNNEFAWFCSNFHEIYEMDPPLTISTLYDDNLGSHPNLLILITPLVTFVIMCVPIFTILAISIGQVTPDDGCESVLVNLSLSYWCGGLVAELLIIASFFAELARGGFHAFLYIFCPIFTIGGAIFTAILPIIISGENSVCFQVKGEGDLGRSLLDLISSISYFHTFCALLLIFLSMMVTDDSINIEKWVVEWKGLFGCSESMELEERMKKGQRYADHYEAQSATDKVVEQFIALILVNIVFSPFDLTGTWICTTYQSDSCKWDNEEEGTLSLRIYFSSLSVVLAIIHVSLLYLSCLTVRIYHPIPIGTVDSVPIFLHDVLCGISYTLALALTIGNFITMNATGGWPAEVFTSNSFRLLVIVINVFWEVWLEEWQQKRNNFQEAHLIYVSAQSGTLPEPSNPSLNNPYPTPHFTDPLGGGGFDDEVWENFDYGTPTLHDPIGNRLEKLKSENNITGGVRRYCVHDEENKEEIPRRVQWLVTDPSVGSPSKACSDGWIWQVRDVVKKDDKDQSHLEFIPSNSNLPHLPLNLRAPLINDGISGAPGNISASHQDLAAITHFTFEEKILYIDSRYFRGLRIDWEIGHQQFNISRDVILDSSIDGLFVLFYSHFLSSHYSVSNSCNDFNTRNDETNLENSL